MIFTPIKLAGAFTVTLDRIGDERGFFARAWCRNEFFEHGLASDFVQANVAFSRRKGTLRGMHYQIPPFEEAKLVRCTRGRIYDVMIDLRQDSPTCMQWHGRVLTARGLDMIYVPEGFAHGYLTLADESEVFYQVSRCYSAEHERGVRWNDPAFGVEWPDMHPLLLSDKDKSWPFFAQEK